MKLVVLESPYFNKDPDILKANMKYLDLCIADCIKRGESPYASHKMLTDALDDNIPEQRELGIRAGLEFSRVCDYVVVYLDKGISSGMNHAIKHHESLGKEIYYRTLFKVNSNDC